MSAEFPDHGPIVGTSTDQRRFSRDHDFSHAELAAAATVIAAEHKSRGLLMTVTMGHRSLALRQVTISSTLGALTMLSLYVLEQVHPTMDRGSLNTWAVATFAYLVLRAIMTYWMFRPLPSEMAKSVWLRMFPLLVVLLTAAQWIWCFNVFIEHELSLHVFILFAGLLGVSIAVIGMWPTIPIAAILYLVTAWPPFFFRLYQVGWVPVPVLMVVGFSVAMVLWSSVYLEVKQLRPILDRSDEVDLLVAKLHGANAELTSANSTLDAMREDSASRLESRSVFYASASHDFRQRLHAVKLMSRSAVHDARSLHLVSAPLVRLADAVEDVDRYITQLLDFARLDAIAPNPERTAVSLQRVFQQLELSFEEVASAAGVKLTVRVTNIALHTDPTMLQRVLENLLSNAIKFSHGRRVLMAARHRGGTVAIEIWDQGPGIPADNQAAIFTPFYQSSVGLKAVNGVGLGLAVVKRFVDCLGYEIAVRSRIGRGTVMIVSVPALDVRKEVHDRG